MTSARILVVDDAAVVRALLRRGLESDGYDVCEAEDGAAALQALAAGGIDVVLLDVEMPGLDGHEVLARMAADETLAHIPVVFLTSRTDASDMAAALEAGGHDYLRKPFEPIELRARLASALRLRRLQDELRARNDELSAVSRTDPLTGLPNRRCLESALAAATAEAARAGEPLSVILLDLDGFKRINDEWGHPTGDEVLVEVGVRLQSSVREHEAVGRWGGEEFLAILPRAALPAALAVAERLRERLRGEPVHTSTGPLRITASFGVAAELTGNPEAALRAADAALYAAKEAGRDCVATPQGPVGG